MLLTIVVLLNILCIGCWIRAGMLVAPELSWRSHGLEQWLTRVLVYTVLVGLAPFWYPMVWIFGPRDEL